MQRNLWIYVLLSCCSLSSSVVFADQHAQPFSNRFTALLASSFVGSLSVGPDFASGGNTQTLPLGPELTRTFTANQPGNTLANVEVLLGVQQPFTRHLQWQIGLDAATTSGATLSGNIWDDASPVFNNYTYRYQLKHTQLGLKGKLIGNYGWSFMPWLSLMLGVGFNEAYSFANTPIIFEAVPTADFTEHTTTTFTYGLGVGVQRTLAKHWQVGLGYEWVNWGKSQLGSLIGGSNSQTISISHFYASSVMLNVTFLASDQ